MVVRIGLLVNPIAGMGGKVGLKGTDGVVEKARKLGAEQIAPKKAEETLKEFYTNFSQNKKINWLTCKGLMGADELISVIGQNIDIIYTPKDSITTSSDTKNACKEFLRQDLDLLLFCGGDGTARDIVKIVNKKIPLLGIPSGVKMHSGVFGITVHATAKILYEFINKRLIIGDVEIMDLDENKYRKGEWNIRLFGTAKGIVEPTYVQVGKSLYESVSDDAVKEELAEHIQDEMKQHPDFLYLFGSGGTIDYIAHKLNFENTLLGIDAVFNDKLVGKDLNEEKLLKLLSKHKKAKVLLSPIGAQGFILGRGNLQLSPKIIKKIGLDNIIVLSTPSKLIHTPFLRVDTGDKRLDKQFAELEFLMVTIGYRLSRVVKIQTNKF
jgi:predicted polyphosphate/ATP-dependent NAD kinase